MPPKKFVDVSEGARHSLGLTADGSVYSWGRSHSLGQLGRETTTTAGRRPGLVPLPNGLKAKWVFASHGSTADSGHSAVVDQDGNLWMAGCDRWLQIGLGSFNGGSTGYSWGKHGKMWQERFVPSHHVIDLMKRTEGANANIRDVALGGDHTLVLSSNRNVYAFGKGGDGQLGLTGKPFVSAPTKSSALSQPGAAAICAFQTCSAVLGEDGSLLKMVGRGCRSSDVLEGLEKCIDRAKANALVDV